jgi:hypothetical protein
LTIAPLYKRHTFNFIRVLTFVYHIPHPLELIAHKLRTHGLNTFFCIEGKKGFSSLLHRCGTKQSYKSMSADKERKEPRRETATERTVQRCHRSQPCGQRDPAAHGRRGAPTTRPTCHACAAYGCCRFVRHAVGWLCLAGSQTDVRGPSHRGMEWNRTDPEANVTSRATCWPRRARFGRCLALSGVGGNAHVGVWPWRCRPPRHRSPSSAGSAFPRGGRRNFGGRTHARVASARSQRGFNKCRARARQVARSLQQLLLLVRLRNGKRGEALGFGFFCARAPRPFGCAVLACIYAWLPLPSRCPL